VFVHKALFASLKGMRGEGSGRKKRMNKWKKWIALKEEGFEGSFFFIIQNHLHLGN